MSYDLTVSFSSWPKDAAGVWADELARMGVDAELHPEFDPLHDNNWCPVALRFETDTELPVSAKLIRFGKFESGFEYFPTESSATFSSKSNEGTLAAFVCACALAAVTQGEVRDHQTRVRASGSNGLEILAGFFPEGTQLEGPRKPVPFKGWEDAEADAESEDAEADDAEE